MLALRANDPRLADRLANLYAQEKKPDKAAAILKKRLDTADPHMRIELIVRIAPTQTICCRPPATSMRRSVGA